MDYKTLLHLLTYKTPEERLNNNNNNNGFEKDSFRSSLIWKSLSTYEYIVYIFYGARSAISGRLKNILPIYYYTIPIPTTYIKCFDADRQALLTSINKVKGTLEDPIMKKKISKMIQVEKGVREDAGGGM